MIKHIMEKIHALTIRIYIYTYVQWTTDLEVFLILVALAATSSGGKQVSATVSQPETKAMSKGKA